MKFNVTGKLKFRETKTFSRVFEAKTKNMATELAYSFFGSTYRLRRNNITIDSVTETK